MESQTTAVSQIPESIESPQGKLVYLYLDVCEEATLEDLQHDLEIPKIALLSVLQSLRKRGFVDASEQFYQAA